MGRIILFGLGEMGRKPGCEENMERRWRNGMEKVEDALGQMKNEDGSVSGRLRYTIVQAILNSDSLSIKEKAKLAKKL